MRRFIPLLTVLSLAFAPAPLTKKGTKTDLQQLQGEWELIGFGPGSPVQPVRTGAQSAVFDGTRVNFYCGNVLESTWEVTLDPVNKWMDKKRSGKKHATVGIYRLNGDVLMIASKNCDIDPKRPPDFEPRDVTCLYVYTRKRP